MNCHYTCCQSFFVLPLLTHLGKQLRFVISRKKDHLQPKNKDKMKIHNFTFMCFISHKIGISPTKHNIQHTQYSLDRILCFSTVLKVHCFINNVLRYPKINEFSKNINDKSTNKICPVSLLFTKVITLFTFIKCACQPIYPLNFSKIQYFLGISGYCL